jgi:hypothetical protein
MLKEWGRLSLVFNMSLRADGRVAKRIETEGEAILW